LGDERGPGRGGLDRGLVAVMAELVPAAAVWQVSERMSEKRAQYLLEDHLGFLLGTGVRVFLRGWVSTIFAIEALG
jgi:hypothetical protein